MAPVKKMLQSTLKAARTSRGRNVLTFLVFLVIATVFWFLMVLNDDVQRDYAVPLRLEGVPADVTFLTTPPTEINVEVKNKGQSLLRYDWGSPPAITVRYNEMHEASDGYRMVVDNQQLAAMVRSAFASGTEILAVRPDSLSLRYTTRPGDRLPLVVDIDAQAAPQYIVTGKIRANVDSVTVYSQRGLPRYVRSLTTQRLDVRDLTDSITVTVDVKAPEGTRVIPSQIEVTIPVQPLVAKKKVLKVQTANVPAGTSLLTFPAQVEVEYLLPMSLYHDDTVIPTAVVDYRDISSSSPNVAVEIVNIPDYYRSVSVKPAAVEYLIERANGSH